MNWQILLFSVICSCHSLPFNLREFQTLLDKEESFIIPRENSNGECHVVGYNAGCCQHIELDKVDLNSTVCANLTYLPTDYGLSFTLTVDGKAFINETVSARNPPALCAELPYTKEIASICLKFYNLNVGNSSFSGCAKIIIDLAYVSVADYGLGCFKIPNKVQSSNVAYAGYQSYHVEDERVKEMTNLSSKKKKMYYLRKPSMIQTLNKRYL